MFRFLSCLCLSLLPLYLQAYDAVKIDVFSCGCMLFMMLAGFPAFGLPSRTDSRFKQAVFRGDVQGLLEKFGLPPLPDQVRRAGDLCMHPCFALDCACAAVSAEKARRGVVDRHLLFRVVPQLPRVRNTLPRSTWFVCIFRSWSNVHTRCCVVGALLPELDALFNGINSGGYIRCLHESTRGEVGEVRRPADEVSVRERKGDTTHSKFPGEYST